MKLYPQVLFGKHIIVPTRLIIDAFKSSLSSKSLFTVLLWNNEFYRVDSHKFHNLDSTCQFCDSLKNGDLYLVIPANWIKSPFCSLLWMEPFSDGIAIYCVITDDGETLRYFQIDDVWEDGLDERQISWQNELKQCLKHWNFIL